MEEAVKSLPEKFKALMKNIAVLVEDHPSPETLKKTGTPPSHTLLGLYHGTPFKYRGPYYGNQPPDVISIYQKPIEHLCSTEKEIREKVREVVRHEVGHYFGISEKRLRENEIRRNNNKDSSDKNVS